MKYILILCVACLCSACIEGMGSGFGKGASRGLSHSLGSGYYPLYLQESYRQEQEEQFEDLQNQVEEQNQLMKNQERIMKDLEWQKNREATDRLLRGDSY